MDLFITLALLLFMLSIPYWGKQTSEPPKSLSAPLMYVCHNNSVDIVVRAEDYDKAHEKYLHDVESGVAKNPGNRIVLLDITPAFTFSDEKWLQEYVTGNLYDKSRVIEGCRLEARFIYVPFTSGMVPLEEDRERFPKMSVDQALKIIWKNRNLGRGV